MDIRAITKQHYDFIYNDPYNYFKRYFPAWDSLPESARQAWENQIKKILSNVAHNHEESKNE